MVIIATSWVDIFIAAPLGFLVGFVVGILAANKYIIVTPRERYRVERRNGEHRDKENEE